MISNETAQVFFHLADRGYPPKLAFRVALTPPLVDRMEGAGM